MDDCNNTNCIPIRPPSYKNALGAASPSQVEFLIWCYILLGCTAQGLVFVRDIFRLVFYWHAFTCYREAADDPNSRASSQASRKDKEAGISAQLFNWWQFEEHKRWEKEKVMAVSSCCVFLFIPVPSLCGSCPFEAWKSLGLVGFWSIWKFPYTSFL